MAVHCYDDSTIKIVVAVAVIITWLTGLHKTCFFIKSNPLGFLALLAFFVFQIFFLDFVGFFVKRPKLMGVGIFACFQLVDLYEFLFASHD